MSEGNEQFLPSTEILIPRQVRICYERALIDDMFRIKRSLDANNFIRLAFPDAQLMYREYFWVILMNQGGYVLGASCIGKGHDKGVLVSPKEIVQLGILSHAHTVIMVHNHPSGRYDPSPQDLFLTKEVQKALSYHSITLSDHLIITEENYFSMANEGLIA